MTSTTFLMLALLIAACVPMLNIFLTWYYLRGARLAPTWSGVLPLAHAVESGQANAPQSRSEDAFSNEGGRVAFQPATGVSDASGLHAEMQSRMKDLAIGFNGHQYTYAGYRYDRLEDAVRYAEIVLSRSTLGSTVA